MVDLGSAHTRFYRPGVGVVIDEPSIIAFRAENGKVAAVGQEARALTIRQPRGIRITRPLKEGTVADCDAATQMLSGFIDRALPQRTLTSLALMVCVPAELTPLELIAYEDLARRAGARKVTLVEAPFAVANGADFDAGVRQSRMVVDLGAGSTDVAVSDHGNLLYASTRRVGGGEIDRNIVRYLQLERKLEVTLETAEEIKIKLARVEPSDDGRSMVVRGRNLMTGLPEEATIESHEIHPLVEPALRVIKQHIRRALEEIPIGVSVDLLDSGITLSGGLALLPGLSESLSRELTLAVRVISNPMLAAVLGAGCLMERGARPSALEDGLESENLDPSHRESSLAKVLKV